MKQTIKDVLSDMSEGQINLGSEAARETISNLISVALKTKGTYTEYDDSEIEEQEARKTWVCEICGENTFEVDYDYIGSGANHLGCELKLGGEEIDGAYTEEEVKDWEEAVGYKEDDVDSYKGIQKLSEEIVDSKDKDYIYESPDGGKTIFKRMVGEDKRELVENWDEIKKDEG